LLPESDIMKSKVIAWEKRIVHDHAVSRFTGSGAALTGSSVGSSHIASGRLLANQDGNQSKSPQP
jgi:hypothetical protein